MAQPPSATPADDASYIDYESFLDPSFEPIAFANTLITTTNDPNDPQLDLSTPLSRVLFDLQEIDTHIHSLTTTSALPLLTYTAEIQSASQTVLSTVDSQVTTLRKAYERLQKAVITRARNAEEVLRVVENLHSVTAQLREVGRALVIARQLEVQIQELSRPDDEYRALVRAAFNIRELRTGGILEVLDDSIVVVRDLKNSVFAPAETLLLAKSREALQGFEVESPVGNGNGGVGNGAGGAGGGARDGFAATAAGVGGRKLESMKARASAGALALYLLSPSPNNISTTPGRLLLSGIQSILNATVNSSLMVLTRSLTALTMLERAITEVAVRARNLVALQELLQGIAMPDAEKKGPEGKGPVLLELVLTQLDTPALQTSFFRSVAAGLEGRVREVVGKGGANARILRGAKERVRTGLRAAVERGGGGEFEMAVMVGAVGALGR